MGAMQRRKGAAFERRIAAELRAAMPGATVRRSLQAHRAYESDVVVEGNAPLVARRIWWELCDSRAPSPLDKLAQAERDVRCREWLPIVVWHRTGAKSVQVTARLGTLCEVLGGEPTVTEGYLGTPVTVDWLQVLARLRELGGGA